MNKTKI